MLRRSPSGEHLIEIKKRKLNHRKREHGWKRGGQTEKGPWPALILNGKQIHLLPLVHKEGNKLVDHVYVLDEQLKSACSSTHCSDIFLEYKAIEKCVTLN